MELGSCLEFRHVTFAYPPARLFGKSSEPVLTDFTWTVPAGSTVVLGPNGAGKTTLLSLGATALRPSVGTVALARLDAGRRADLAEFRRKVGWMPQRVRAVPGLTSREQVAYAGWLKGMSRSDAWAAAPRALATVGLTDASEKLTAVLSGGQQRRVGLAQILIHRADVLLLDEPTVGLDPSQRARFRETLRDVAQGTQLIVSTHQVDDLTALFDTVVVLEHGRLVFNGTVEAFMAMAPADHPHPAEAAYGALTGANT